MDCMRKVAEVLAPKYTYTEAEVRLVMAGMQAELDALRADAEKWREWRAAQDSVEKEMPEGYCVVLRMAPGDWGISLEDPQGETIQVHDFESTAHFVREAIQAAATHDANTAG